MACILGSELNESFSTYWVIVKNDIHKLTQKSLDIRSNMLNAECHVTFMTAGSVRHTWRNVLNKNFSPSHLTQCKSTTSNSFWWYNQTFFCILVIFWGYTSSHWPSDHCQPLSTRNMSEIVLLMVHNQSVFIVFWEMWTVYAQVWMNWYCKFGFLKHRMLQYATWTMGPDLGIMQLYHSKFYKEVW